MSAPAPSPDAVIANPQPAAPDGITAPGFAKSLAAEALAGLIGAPPVPPSAPAGAPPAPPAGAPPVVPSAPAPVASPSTSVPDPILGLADRFTKPPDSVAPAPVAAPAAPAAPEPEPQIQMGADGKPDKAGHAFAKLRHERNLFERQSAEKDTRISTLEAEKAEFAKQQAAIAAEKARLEQEKTELQERLGRVSLAESPVFQQKYGQREAELETRFATTLTKFAKVKPEDAVTTARQMLRADPAQLQEMIKDLHPSFQGAALMAAGEFAQLDEQRNQELINWRQSAAANNIESARTEVIRSAEQRRKWADDALAAARTLGNPIYAAQDDRGKQIAASVSEAFQGFAQSATEEQLTRAAAEGFAAPLLYQTIQEQTAQIQALTERLEAFDRAQSIPFFPGMPAPAPAPAPVGKATGVTPAADLDDPGMMGREVAAGLLRTLQQANQGGSR